MLFASLLVQWLLLQAEELLLVEGLLKVELLQGIEDTYAEVEEGGMAMELNLADFDKRKMIDSQVVHNIQTVSCCKCLNPLTTFSQSLVLSGIWLQHDMQLFILSSSIQGTNSRRSSITCKTNEPNYES